jgi:hypothetical protein
MEEMKELKISLDYLALTYGIKLYSANVEYDDYGDATLTIKGFRR